MRLLGVLATGTLLAIFASAVVTFMPERGQETVVTAAPASTPEPAAEKKKAAKKKPKLTRAQRRARAAAVATLRELGYRPVTLKDYRPDKTLRVLIGKGEGGRRAFFFVGGRYLGNDAGDDSQRIQVVRAGNRSVSLAYKLFDAGDRPCCPSGGKARVLFRWDGEALAPQTAIPPSTERRAPGA
jgi:hypothetical protein